MAVNDGEVLTTSNSDVTFKKDSTTNYNPQTDNVSGRIYFKKNGIFVDGYQYSELLPITIGQAVKDGIPESAWTNCFDLTSLTNGTYIINAALGNDVYSGIISYSGTGGEEIPLHRSGNGQDRIFLKTDGINLKIASTSALIDITLNIKFRKML